MISASLNSLDKLDALKELERKKYKEKKQAKQQTQQAISSSKTGYFVGFPSPSLYLDPNDPVFVAILVTYNHLDLY
jgi:hypothetical protein